jgi:hypothetical protein
MERLRMRRLGDVDNDLRELRMWRWRQRVNNREGCGCVMKKVKVVGGPYSKGVSKLNVSER